MLALPIWKERLSWSWCLPAGNWLRISGRTLGECTDKANTFQRWELVKYLCEHGFDIYSMGAWPVEQHHTFKKACRTVSAILHWNQGKSANCVNRCVISGRKGIQGLPLRTEQVQGYRIQA